VRGLRPRRSLPVRHGLSGGLAALALGLAACTGGAAAQSRWIERAALEARRTGTFQNPALGESSGVAASRREPGLLWSLNDSGNRPRLFATDTLGTDRGSFTVTGARNEDWEALALGPCGTTDCLYIADTGDNAEARSTVRLYRVPEPRSGAAGHQGATKRAEVLPLRYPDGAHDVEAAFVDRSGAVHLIGKGRDGTVRHYRVPASAWGRGAAVAEALDPLPIETDRDRGQLVTDAALSPDGERVAVRTYRSILFLELIPANGLRSRDVACGITGLELQGEGIDWLDDATVVLTSEGVLSFPGTVSVARCGVS
jgi:hypothetical protein